MELYINSPAYFTNMYGIDDEVYKYCQMLHQNGASFNIFWVAQDDVIDPEHSKMLAKALEETGIPCRN